jgi:SAM-dependent methyltransferase
MVKRVIRSIVKRLGFDIKRIGRVGQLITLHDYDEFSEESLKRKRFFNIGAGRFRHPYWTNVDFATDHYADAQVGSRFLQYDLMALRPLPIEDGVAELVYSSHTIEHVTDEAVRNMLRESYRVLKPGGGIRLTAPDAWLDLEAYRKNDIGFWYWADMYSAPGTWESHYKIPLSEASIHQLFLHHFASQLCEIDIDGSPQKKISDSEISEYISSHHDASCLEYFTSQCSFSSEHPGNHINWWTREKVISFLQEAGFSTPYVSGWGQSVFPPLRDTSIFDSTHPKISLYVEAIK